MDLHQTRKIGKSAKKRLALSFATFSKLDFALFGLKPRERSKLQRNEFLGRGINTPSKKFITLELAPLSRLKSKKCKVELKDLYEQKGDNYDD